jgi:16S rRNA (cytosine1402-N4)-methyltransferase
VRLASYHTPVLRDEVLGWLLTSTAGVYVDATLGGGGHSESILQRLDPAGILIGLDTDPDAIRFAADRLSGFAGRVQLVQSNFRNIAVTLAQRGIHRINGIVFDLGVSSHQFDEPGRGFSFRSDDLLDMRMDRAQPLDARTVVNEYSERSLSDLFWKYGEERAARRIARVIAQQRMTARIESTAQLASIVRDIVGERYLVKSLARIFQALRIEVNNELESLEIGLRQTISLLELHGRIVVISYHSLEDRIVKDFFKHEAATLLPSGNKLVPDTRLEPTLRVLTKKPVEASEEEVRQNPRARSAKLRVAEKIQ